MIRQILLWEPETEILEGLQGLEINEWGQGQDDDNLGAVGKMPTYGQNHAEMSLSKTFEL